MPDNQPKAKGLISLKEKISYGCGDLASNLVLVLTSTYIVFFYTEALKLNVAVIGTIMLVSRLLDGFTDILMGFIMDHTHSKYGKARPWILWLAIPFGIFTALVMCVPPMWSDMAKYIYVFVSYNIIVTILYTAINIPYGALNSLMTRDQGERQSINIFRMVMAQVGSLIINGFTLPLVNAVGGSGDQKSWIIIACIYGALASVLFLICFRNTKERVQAVTEKDQHISFGKTLKLLVKNNYWLLLCLVWVVSVLGMSMGMSTGTYYFKYMLGNENLYGYLTMIQTAVGIIGMIAMAPLVTKFGKRNVALVGSIISFTGQALMLVAPTNVAWLAFTCVVKGVGSATLSGTIFTMIADTIEYGQWKTGTRVEGSLYSATTFGAKVGAGVGMAVATSIMGAAGYNGALTVQSAAALNSISTLYLIAPLPFLAVIPVIYWFYKLDARYPKIMEDLAAREKESAHA